MATRLRREVAIVTIVYKIQSKLGHFVPLI